MENFFSLRSKYSKLITNSLSQKECNTCVFYAIASACTDRLRILGLLDKDDFISPILLTKMYYCNQYECKEFCKIKPIYASNVIKFLIDKDLISYYNLIYKNLKIKGYKKVSEDKIQEEIYNYGTVICTIEIFLTNDNRNLYQYNDGIFGEYWWPNIPKCKSIFHTICIIGWGINKKGIKYWICRNSWGTDFGYNGDFKILRGKNCCDIENNIFSIFFKI